MPGHIPLNIVCHPVRPQWVTNKAECKDSRNKVARSNTDCGPGGNVPADSIRRRQNPTIEQEYRELGAARTAE